MECYATHQEDSIFNFFAALYCSCLGFNALLVLPTKEGGNKGIKNKFCLKTYKSCLKVILFFQQEIFSFGEFFRLKHFFKNCGSLLYKRAELDLRLTKLISVKSGLTKTGLTAKCTIFVCNGFECFIGWELGNNLQKNCFGCLQQVMPYGKIVLNFEELTRSSTVANPNVSFYLCLS